MLCHVRNASIHWETLNFQRWKRKYLNSAIGTEQSQQKSGNQSAWQQLGHWRTETSNHTRASFLFHHIRSTYRWSSPGTRVINRHYFAQNTFTFIGFTYCSCLFVLYRTNCKIIILNISLQLQVNFLCASKPNLRRPQRPPDPIVW